jgi:hypothetical protein
MKNEFAVFVEMWLAVTVDSEDRLTWTLMEDERAQLVGTVETFAAIRQLQLTSGIHRVSLDRAASVRFRDVTPYPEAWLADGWSPAP